MFKQLSQSPWSKLVALLLVTGLTGFLAYQGARMFRKSPQSLAPDVLESVAYLNDLRLVKYYYEALIPVYKDYDKKGRPKGRLQFIAVCPAEVSGYVDLSEMQYDFRGDSTVEVTLPNPRYTKPIIHIDSLRDYAIRNRGFALRLPGFSSNLSTKAFTAIQTALLKTKEITAKKALENGILKRTRRLTELYVRNTLHELGYRVQFTAPSESERLRNSLLPEIHGDAFLEQLPLPQRLDLLERLQKFSPNPNSQP